MSSKRTPRTTSSARNALYPRSLSHVKLISVWILFDAKSVFRDVAIILLLLSLNAVSRLIHLGKKRKKKEKKAIKNLHVMFVRST